MCVGGIGIQARVVLGVSCIQMSQQRSAQCGPCSLCKQESTRYYHKYKWEPQIQIRYMLLLGIQDYDTHHICICRAGHHDLTCNNSKPNYIPRSIKISNKSSLAQEKCTVTGCSNQADIKSTDSIYNFEDIPGGIEFNPILPLQAYVLPTNTSCTSISIKSTTCSAKLKPSEKFKQALPQPNSNRKVPS